MVVAKHCTLCETEGGGVLLDHFPEFITNLTEASISYLPTILVRKFDKWVESMTGVNHLSD